MYIECTIGRFLFRLLTFIINNNVLKTISIIIKYSNGVETTIRHILYLKLFRLFGMYLSNGRACIVKSIQDFWKIAILMGNFLKMR